MRNAYPHAENVVALTNVFTSNNLKAYDEDMQSVSRRASLNKRQALQLGRLLKARRHELGLSNYQLSELSGVNVATISRLEHAAILTPQPETLRALGAPLGLSSYELFSACEWITGNDLPSLGAYLRVKYRDLSEADIAELQEQIHELGRDARLRGPLDHEDETTDEKGGDV